MVLDILGLGKKKKDPNYWKDKLNIAWSNLDNNKLDQASNQFNEISSELDRIGITPQLSSIFTESKTGLWATRYK